MKPTRQERKHAMNASLAARPVRVRLAWVLTGTAVAFVVGWLAELLMSGPTNWAFLGLMACCIGIVLAWQYVIAPTRWARIHRQ